MTPRPPTLVVTNARIATGDPRRPWATALAIDGTTLAAVAAAAEILKMIGTETRILDAHGQTIVLPAGAVAGATVRVEIHADGAISVTAD